MDQIETYIESIIDSRDNEFLSLHNCSIYSTFRAYENQSPVDDGIEYEEKQVDQKSFKYVFDNRICMISTTSPPNEDKDLCLMHPHLIDWGQEETPYLGCFQNDEAIAEFLGARDRFPYDDHKASFTIDLDRTA